ncbi:hypothetical protein [Amylibacter sp. IMCC11727]|uniref:hypothetical protein n=1 Tax=Amylibacter sp. IMCC11727 TaxID=3039851 RepID=UPI00244DEEE7|nr:hypothetical protein [Amylibacter sp. IMCC11727]WGI21419.1 hypothetical protein QBD29_15065 [Amylibacter sp. IMCC11727]
MTLVKTLIRPVIIGATALSLTAPMAQADGKDVALGLVGGLIIGKVIADSQQDRAENQYVYTNRHKAQRHKHVSKRRSFYKRHRHGGRIHTHRYHKRHTHWN